MDGWMDGEVVTIVFLEQIGVASNHFLLLQHNDGNNNDERGNAMRAETPRHPHIIADERFLGLLGRYGQFSVVDTAEK